MRIGRWLLASATALALLGGAGAAAFAAGAGYATATAQTSCAYAGAFGAFGPGVNFGNATSGHISEPGNALNGNGADGPATGSNNANLCGQPQGNP